MPDESKSSSTATTFFITWPTWAQLSFVLAGLLVIIMITATTVKFGLWRRTKLHEKLLAADVAEKGGFVTSEIPSDILFGIRLMEEQPDIDGVWNSRKTTPLQTPLHGSRNSSPKLQPMRKLQKSRRLSTSSSIFNMFVDHDRSPAQATTTVFVNSEAPRAKPSSQLSEVGKSHKKPPKSVVIRYSGSGDRPLNNRSFLNQDDTQLSMQGPDKEKENIPPSISTKEKRSEPFQVRKYIIDSKGRNSGVPRVRSKSEGMNAIQFMDNHRKFHAAESGQLIARTQIRRTTRSLTSVDEQLKEIESQQGTRTLTWPAKYARSNSSDSGSSISSRTMNPHAVPFRAFVETHPPPTKICPSAWTEKTRILMDGALEVQKSKTESTLPTLSSGIGDISTNPTSSLSSFCSLDGNVSIKNTASRRVNAGFEILPAGSLDFSQYCPNTNSLPQSKREASKDDSKRRKLQKKSSTDTVKDYNIRPTRKYIVR